MTLPFDRQIEHLLRRAGFGARSDELDMFRARVDPRRGRALLDYERCPDDVDQKIGQPGYVGMTVRGRVLAADRTSPTRGSAGCSGWCTPTGRCRRR